MRAVKFMLWITSTALMSVTVLASPSMAQSNQSDITGTNVFESYAPDFFELEELDPELAARAEELSQELEEANQACIDSRVAVTNQPRRFARGPRHSNADCISPECLRLNQLTEEARAFLAQVEAQIEEVNQAVDSRTW